MLHEAVPAGPAGRLQLVVLSYNRPECLPRQFEQLILPAARAGVLVSFVDNHSGSEVIDILMSHQGIANLNIILNKQNLGVAQGRNTGFKQAEREFLVCLDDDSLLDVPDLLTIPSHFDRFPQAGILTFNVIHGETGEMQTPFGETEQEVGNFHGAGHAIRRSLFDQVGLLDEECFFGGEELEYSMRARLVGMRTRHVPITVRHFSHLRSGPVGVDRCFRWASNYARVLSRYLPLSKAALFASRLSIGYVYHLVRTGHPLAACRLPIRMLRGLGEGRRSRRPLPTEDRLYYLSPSTRPELGNVPLLGKALKRLRGRRL